MTPATRTALQPLKTIDEKKREFEIAIVNMATNPPFPNFLADITSHIDTLLTASPAPTSATVTADDFLAYCVLINYQRRMKNFDEQERYIRDYRHLFSPCHPFFDHMDLLSRMDNMQSYTEREMLQLADKNCLQLKHHNLGALHAYCEIIALLYESRNDAPALDKVPTDELAAHLEKALDGIETVLDNDQNYAKYYCTKGRLQTAKKLYPDAIRNITKAISIEDSSRSDYTLRVNQYQIHLQQTKNLQALDRTETQLNTKIAQFEEIIEQQTKESLIKNMEYLGLFAGIISFTIGSISIASSVAEQSLIAAAGLIVVLLGALLCVFAGFGFILHGVTDKARRNLAVFVMGAVVILGGVLLCLI